MARVSFERAPRAARLLVTIAMVSSSSVVRVWLRGTSHRRNGVAVSRHHCAIDVNATTVAACSACGGLGVALLQFAESVGVRGDSNLSGSRMMSVYRALFE